MFKAAFKRSFVGASRWLFFDKLCAYAEGGWRAVRRMLREIATLRLAPPQEKKRSVRLAMEVLEARTVPTSVSVLPLTDPPYYQALVPLGEANVDEEVGTVRLSQALDFDQSPGTSIGGDPALVYNGSTVDGMDGAFEIAVAPNSSPVLSAIKAQLTWDDGTPGSWVTFGPYYASQPEMVGLAMPSVAQTGRYDWQVNVVYLPEMIAGFAA